MIHLVTGYGGKAHIKSEDEGALNAGCFGDGQCVIATGNKFSASIIDNNTVRVLDGDGVMYGRHFRLEPNSYEDVTISTGTQGKNRIDLIVMTYEKSTSGGTEQCYLQVIKGEESTGTPTTPDYTVGNILEGAETNQMPLYKVTIEGVVLSKLESQFEVLGGNLSTLSNRVEVLESRSSGYAGLVCHGYDNSVTSCSTTSGNYSQVNAYASFDKGDYYGYAEPLIDQTYAQGSRGRLLINKNGLYLFDIRAQFNSHTANKRVEFCPFIDGTRDGTHSYSFCTPGDFYLTYNVQIPLRLTAGQTVYFAIAPVENVAVSAKIVDINVWALDWEGK